jgi:large subunit ribosomal protein L21
MYAVIKTGGKQYRVQAGDVLVVEKLEGEAGAAVAFNEVLMIGEGADVVIGAPLVDGAVVSATLIETRKGEKVKIFKKIRRQGYRRTRGHRQFESVLRVTSVASGKTESKWDGVVDLTTKAVLDARARNLKSVAEALVAPAAAPVTKKAAAPKAAAPKAAAPKPAPKAKAEAAPAAEAPAAEVKTAAAPKKAAAPKSEAKAEAAPKKAAPKAKAKSAE